MNSSKSLTLLRGIEHQEFGQLRKFIRSVYHNKHEGVIALCEYLMKRRDGASKHLAKAVIYRSLFPGQQYDDLKMRHLISYLQRVLEDFVTRKAEEEDPLSRGIQLLHAARKRNLDSYFDFQRNKVQKAFAANQKRDSIYYRNRLEFHEEVLQHQLLKSKAVEQELQAASESIDLHFVITKLQHACTALTHQNVSNARYELPFIAAVVAHVEEHQLYHNPIVGIYYYAYLIFSQAPGDHFESLQRLLNEHQQAWGAEEQRRIYLGTINFFIQRWNAGDEEILPHAHLLYMQGLENGALLQGDILSPWTYKNAITIAIKINELEAAESVIETYQSSLAAPVRAEFYAYAQALLCLAKNRPKDAIARLRTQPFTDHFTQSAVYVIRIKAHYELQDHDYLDYLLHSYERFLKGKKVLPKQRDNYGAFVKLVRKLIGLKEFDDEGKVKLRAEIESVAVLTERSWLLSKL